MGSKMKCAATVIFDLDMRVLLNPVSPPPLEWAYSLEVRVSDTLVHTQGEMAACGMCGTCGMCGKGSGYDMMEYVQIPLSISSLDYSASTCVRMVWATSDVANG